MARTIKIENKSGAAKTWIGQRLTNDEMFDIPEHRMSKWANDSTVITDVASGDLKVIKSEGPTVYYTAAEGQRVLDGLDPNIAAGGGSGELLCTDASGTIVWWQGTVIIQEEGVQVGSIPCNTLNFIGSDITATDAGSGQANITVTSSGGGGFTDFDEVSSEAESTTTSATFVEKLKMTTASLPNGTYRIGWYCEMMNDDPSGKIDLQVQLDDTTNLANVHWEPKDGTNWIMQSGFKYEVLTGIHDIDIDYSQQGFGTAKIRKARIEIWKVA